MSSQDTFRKLVCQKITPDFANAVGIVEAPRRTPKDNEVLVKTKYVGINSADILFTADKFLQFKEPRGLPFDLGMEGLGEVLELGAKVKEFSVGQTVAYVSLNTYAELVYVPVEELIPVPSAQPEFLSLLVSGLTASIGLEKAGEIKKGEKVLITSAAGGLGQFAIQWAKSIGCHVIGTCSSNEKAEFIKFSRNYSNDLDGKFKVTESWLPESLGCDFVINYKEENLGKVLKTHYQDGLDVIWETIGGKTFETLTNHLAVKGRLVIIGTAGGYQTVGIPPVDISVLPAQLRYSASSLRGFNFLHFRSDHVRYFTRLSDLMAKDQLKVRLDQGETTPGGRFKGLEDITRAVQHILSGKSSGKVVVPISV